MKIRSSWFDILQQCQADATLRDRLLYRFLPEGEADRPAIEWTFAKLERRARAIAAELQARKAVGERVILLHPPGLEFAAAFMACLYAGAVAVPTFPPRTAGGDRQSARLAAVIDSAKPILIATTTDAEARCKASIGSSATPIVATDAIPDSHGDAWRPSPLAGSRLGCLQYTSGTSGTPKGVMLTHDALLANSAQIEACFGHTRDSRGVIWLPPYHDMGLVGGILQPLYAGFEVTLMPATAFLQKPIRWLRAVDRFRGTTSGGPNFAYSACVESIDDATLATLDLSSWDVAFCGAEPVRAATMNRFAERFARCGLNARALLPCYGMAEATLMISGALKGTGVTTDQSADAQVSCGPPTPGTSVMIVDPETSKPLPDGSPGEIWVTGPGIAAGYWKEPELTANAFTARIEGSTKHMLRTGDIGFIRDGRLFVTGRLKDLIIIRGVNHAPEDLEHTAQSAHAALQPQGGAAFSITHTDGEGAVIVHELRREVRNTADPLEVCAAVRGAIAEVHGIELSAIALVKPGTVPRTQSGKTQRSACRAAYLEGSLDPIFTWTRSPVASGPAAIAILSAPPSSLLAELTTWLRIRTAAVIGCPAADVDVDEPLARYGIGSGDAVGLAGQISQELGVDLAATALWDYPTIGELARYLIDEAHVIIVPALPAAGLQSAR